MGHRRIALPRAHRTAQACRFTMKLGVKLGPGAGCSAGAACRWGKPETTGTREIEVLWKYFASPLGPKSHVGAMGKALGKAETTGRRTSGGTGGMLLFAPGDLLEMYWSHLRSAKHFCN